MKSNDWQPPSQISQNFPRLCANTLRIHYVCSLSGFISFFLFSFFFFWGGGGGGEGGGREGGGGEGEREREIGGERRDLAPCINLSVSSPEIFADLTASNLL